MELRHLRYLLAIADAKSFVAAAARLQLAQPALTRQIQDLEEELGFPLVTRHARGSELNDAGAAVVRLARPLVDQVKEAIERARLSEHGIVGRCTIAVSRFALASGMVGRLFAHVRREYPGIELILDDRQLYDQWDAIERCEVDIGIGTPPSAKQLHLAVETAAIDAFDGLIISAAHPLAGRSEVRLAELRDETFVCVAPEVESESIRALRGEFAARAFAPRAEIHSSNGDEILLHVGAGKGWAITPATMRASPPAGVRALRISDLSVPIRYVLIHRRSDERPIVRSVLGALRRAAKDIGVSAMTEPDSGIHTLPEAARNGFASRVELRHLRYFVAIVQHETMGRAAEALGLTQPTLSRALKDLEDEVGATLLTRTARGVAPTLAGESLRSDAARILATADQLGVEARRALRGFDGRVVLGMAISPIAATFISRAIEACTADHPSLDVVIDTVHTPHQGAAVSEGRLDLGIGYRFPVLSAMDPALARLTVMPDIADQVLLHREHPLAAREEISLRELGDFPFIFMKRDYAPSMYDIVMSEMARAHFTPRIEGTFDSFTVTWSLSAQGLGWCLGSRAQIAHPPEGLKAVRLRDFSLPWGLELTYRRDEARPAVLALIDAIRVAAARSSAFVTRSLHDDDAAVMSRMTSP